MTNVDCECVSIVLVETQFVQLFQQFYLELLDMLVMYSAVKASTSSNCTVKQLICQHFQ